MSFLFTSESVSIGHPDKICDQVSDAILDACLSQNPYSHVACECFISSDLLVIGGEITTNAQINIKKIASNVLKEIGYVDEKIGFNVNTCKIIVNIDKQSSDIERGTNLEVGGAGDQGMMFGYATTETKEYMPLAISLAHELVRVATEKRLIKQFQYAGPDMKSQVTIAYDDEIGNRIDTIVMSIQHEADYDEGNFVSYIKKDIIMSVVEKYNMNSDFKILINPTGRFVIGGPIGDTGLTGRKIIVDTYGGYARHGGGAFSGKDPSKVDRSGAYMARYIAKNIVAAGLAREIEVQLSYAIGVAYPVSISIETFNTEKVSKKDILLIIENLFDLTPLGIIETLNLRRAIYRKTSCFGHFGRTDVNFPWENLDMVNQIIKYSSSIK